MQVVVKLIFFVPYMSVKILKIIPNTYMHEQLHDEFLHQETFYNKIYILYNETRS